MDRSLAQLKSSSWTHDYTIMSFYSSSRPTSPPPAPTSQPLPPQKPVPQHVTFATRQQKLRTAPFSNAILPPSVLAHPAGHAEEVVSQMFSPMIVGGTHLVPQHVTFATRQQKVCSAYNHGTEHLAHYFFSMSRSCPDLDVPIIAP
jgi:hypothetical protein